MKLRLWVTDYINYRNSHIHMYLFNHMLICESIYKCWHHYNRNLHKKLKTKLRGHSLQANYTD
jgi:SET domain-containing protein